jgi:hypothetical protein
VKINVILLRVYTEDQMLILFLRQERKNKIILTFSGASLALSSSINAPAAENMRSEGTDEAGIAK